MGRHRKHPLSNGNVASEPSGQSSISIRKDVESRLGLNKQICMSCNARNPEDADSCRKCGHNQLRGKKSEYADG